MRTWTKLGLALLLAAPLAAPARAGDPEVTPQKIEKLQRDLESLHRRVESLEREVRESSLRGARTAEEMRDLLTQLLRKQDEMSAQVRSSFYMPPAGAPAATQPAPVVTLRNQYLATATVTINGQPFTVAPGQTVDVRNLPPGPFTYEVAVDGYGLVQPPTTTTLAPTGRVITIFPR